MAQAVADRNLLLGILAVQMDFITRDQLVAAMNSWVLDKNKPLGQILLDQNALSVQRQALLEALVQEHLKQHDGDVEKSLAAVSSIPSLREDLKKIADPDLQASLGHLPLPQGEGRGEGSALRAADEHATTAPSVGTATSTGTRFRILRPHAKGGLGEVYIASDEELHRHVALKQMQDRHADNAESRARFLLEAEITGGLEHPGIVPVYGLGTYADGRPFYAMRFVRGDSLKEAIEQFHGWSPAFRLAANEPPSPGTLKRGLQRGASRLQFESVEFRKLLGRFIDVCNAIQYANDRGVLHRDLKPGNIMLGPYGETLVVDWGLAKAGIRSQQSEVRSQKTGEPGALATGGSPLPEGEGLGVRGEPLLIPQSGSGVEETRAGSVIGTPQYMSPEQAAGRLDLLGPASDVYNLGATLYCLLTGKAPFDEEDVGPLLRKVERGEFPPPRQRHAEIPRALEGICLKAMAVKPADRYSSPALLAEGIERWLADEPVTAWPEPVTVKARRWVARHRTLVTASAAAVLVSVLSLTMLTVMLSAANEDLLAANKAERDAKDMASLKEGEAAKERDNALNEQKRAEQEKVSADLARKQAERETKEADLARAKAEREKKRADEQLLRAEWLLYAANISRAQREWEAANGHLADHYLALCRRDFRGWEHDYLWTLLNQKTFRGHAGLVNSVSFSPDGKRLVSGSWDMTVNVWDAATGQETRTLKGHTGPVNSVAFSPDGKRLVSGSHDKTLKVWDASRSQSRDEKP